MGYNTRRKSLSLTELGITLPKRARTQSHPSPPNTIVEGEESDRPSKKSRLMSPPQIKSSQAASQLSPPPSPVAEGRNKVDIEGISDDIVVGTIQQLEQTGNRPHLVKELATVLATNLHSVEKSANPSALISSRLTAYLNRSWPTISPCPLAKDLSPVHPRRLYFFLTTMPRQPIPDTIEQPEPKSANRIISPSLSSASAADEEEAAQLYKRSRQALSPSPEVDLSSPELEDESQREPPTPGAPFSGRNSVARERSQSASNLSHGRRGGSPQLEHEERDFKQTATALYEQAQLQRRSSEHEEESKKKEANNEQGDDHASAGAEQSVNDGTVAMSIESADEDDDELATLRHSSEDAAALFGSYGPTEHLKVLELQQPGMEMFSSPVMRPQLDTAASTATDSLTTSAKREPSQHDEDPEDDVMHLDLSLDKNSNNANAMLDWDTLKSPENIDVAELEDMFDAY